MLFDMFYTIFDPFGSNLDQIWKFLGESRILHFLNFGQLGMDFSYQKSGDGNFFFRERPACGWMLTDGGGGSAAALEGR